MKILFVNPILKADYSALDVAITLLASIVNKTKNHQAKIVDTTFHYYSWQKHIEKNINSFEPDIIGFSCNNLYMPTIRKISDFIRKKFPQIKIIGGGYYCSIYPEEAIIEKNFDGILIGDSEKSLVDILDYIEKNNRLPTNLKGFWVRKGKKIFRTGKGEFAQDINNFPYLDWDLWEDLDKYLYFLQMIYFVGSRGCPYTCSFCEACEVESYVEGKYFRLMNPKRYAQEIAYQWKKYESRGMKLAQIFDPVFTINKEWLKEFAKEYKSLLNPKNYPLSVFSRIDNLDKEKVEILSSMGCKIVRMGIESGDDGIRHFIHGKKISTKNIIEINNLLDKHKMIKTNFFILGAPSETKETMNKTISLAWKLNASRTAFFIYKPVTKYSVELVNKTDSKIDYDKMSKNDNLQYGSVIKLKGISHFGVEFLQKKAYFIYLSKKIFGMIKEQKLKYFSRMIVYVFLGLKNGLSIKYLIPYYHIYAYDNIKK